MSSNSQKVTFSIVSHQQGHLVRQFLSDLRRGVDCNFEVLLTLNIPEDETFIGEFADLPIRVIRNLSPKGFGANHNSAFMASDSAFFAVVNPDIRVAERLAIQPLLNTFHVSDVGACGPAVLNNDGTIEDSARQFPTVWRLLKRVLFGVRRSDYVWQQSAISVDWLAGMFIIFRREAFASLRGFDERYFMYFEDADICKRMKRFGWSVRLNPTVTVIHTAQRASHRSAKHLYWHLTSAVRFITEI